MGGYVSVPLFMFLFMLFSDTVFACEVLSTLKKNEEKREQKLEQESVFKWSHQAVLLLKNIGNEKKMSYQVRCYVLFDMF